MIQGLQMFKRAVRWDSWAQGKLPLFCTIIFYLVLKESLYATKAIETFFLLLGFAVLTSIYGYLINDLFDIEIDRAQGKKNVFATVGRLPATLAVLIIFVSGVLVGSRFFSHDYFVYLFIFFYVLATCYSARPVRLKERGALGLFTAFLCQYPIPILIIFSIFGGFGGADMWGIVLLGAISGATLEIGHQRSDLKSDTATKTTTFAVRTGQKKIDAIYKPLLLLDITATLGIVLIMKLELDGNNLLYGAHLMSPPLLVFLILALLSARKIMACDLALVDPYYTEGRRDLLNITYILFPNFLLPMYLACVAFLRYPWFAFFVVTFSLITFINYPSASISWPFRVVYRELRNSIGL